MENSKWYREGYSARGDDNITGFTTDCPYGAQSAKWFLWMEGYKAPQPDPKDAVDGVPPSA